MPSPNSIFLLASQDMDSLMMPLFLFCPTEGESFKKPKMGLIPQLVPYTFICIRAEWMLHRLLRGLPFLFKKPLGDLSTMATSRLGLSKFIDWLGLVSGHTSLELSIVEPLGGLWAFGPSSPTLSSVWPVLAVFFLPGPIPPVLTLHPLFFSHIFLSRAL